MFHKKRLLFTLCLIFALTSLPAVHLNKAEKNILYLSTGDSKTDSIQFSAIANALPENCRLYYQSLNYDFYTSETDTSSEETYWPFDFLDISKFNAVITGDNLAFEFVHQYYDAHFKSTPIISLISDSDDFSSNLNKMEHSYAIKDSIFFDENIKLATSLFPARKQIIFIGCSNEQRQNYEKSVKKFEIDSDFKNISKMGKEKIEKYISSLKKCSIIYLPSTKELNENILNSEQILDIILENTENPVFICHDIGLGNGVLGGYFVSAEELGNVVGRKINQIFAYNIMNNTTKDFQLQANYYFDVQKMNVFKIKKNQLNTRSIFINDTPSKFTRINFIILFLTLNFILIAAIAYIIITAKKRISIQKNYLNEERSKLNAVLSQSDALFWECAFSTDDNEIETFLGADEEEKTEQTNNIAQGWIDSGLIPTQYIERYNKMIADIRSGAETVSIDLPLQQEDSHTHLTNTHWKHIVYKTINQNTGKIIRAIATATDITNQKRAEEEYEGEMSYRAFVNKEYPVYTRLNLTNNVIMERMINVPELKLTVADSSADSELALIVRTATNNGQNLSLSAALTRKELLTAFTNGSRTRDWDFYYTFANGITRWYKLTVELSSNPYTSCVEANIYMREITNYKIMAISKDSVLDEEVEYIFWLDLPETKCHIIHKANYASWIPIEEDTDYHELTEYMLNNLISTKDRETVEQFFSLKHLTVKLKDKTAANCTFEIITDNLRVAIKQMRSYYLSGNQNVILFICRDITDITLFEKLQNEKLSRAIEQAEKANASKSDFLSRMSHDLRTPMNGIIGMAELAEDEIDKPQALKEDIRKIKSSSKYMLGLLNDILDMAKIESGKLEIRKSRQSAGEIIEAITTMANSMCEQNKITFYCNVDPNKYRNFFINVDRLHLQQVIMNLLSNASKFTPPQGRIEFLLKILERTEKTINTEITISDTGSGMTKEFQKVMFEAFTQDVNSVNKVGTGLGLSIVHNLIKLMGGTIECQSAPGEGTTFTIQLAIDFIEESTDDSSEKSDTNAKSKTANDLTGKRILLVEDNPLNQEISRRVLQKKGMVVTIAENGLVALNTFSDNPENSFDLILMDVMMPVMGGIESAHLLRSLDRKDAKEIPIIALTANAFTEDIQKCIDAGMNTHLSKPIDPLLLISTISEYLTETVES